MPKEIIKAFGTLKKAAAHANCQLGVLPAEKRDAISAVCDEIVRGELYDQFPLVIWQTGSGTQSNMNVNEVIAGIANEALAGTRGGKTPVHPNDHVNMGQSSNDSFPTAIHVAVAIAVWRDLLPALQRLTDALTEKCKAWGAIIKIGRTHLQDATPLTLGQEFSAFVAQLIANRARVEGTIVHNVQKLAQGGTAVGTGLNAPAGFDVSIAAEISTATGIAFEPARNKFEALASNDGLVQMSGTLNTLAVSLTKIANDIRLLGSGPRSGLGELHLPENEPGSSIMPGKVNPVIPEAVAMVCAQVMGNHATVSIAGQSGSFQLNTMMPVIAYNSIQNLNLLASACSHLAEKAIDGLKFNKARMSEALARNPMLVTALNPVIGYEKAAQIAKRAYAEKRPLIDVAREMTDLSLADLKRLLDPARLTA